MNSRKRFTDMDQFYNFIHFSFYTSIFRLCQNTGPKTVQTNKNWYLQKGKRFQITSKVIFVRKLNVKTIDYTSILGFFPEKINFLKKTWYGYINFLTDDIGSGGWKSPLRKKHVKRKLVFSEINRHMLTIEIEIEQTVDVKDFLHFFRIYTKIW